MVQNKNSVSLKVKCKKGIMEISPHTAPLPSRWGIHTVISPGKHSEYFKSQLAFHGVCEKLSCISHPCSLSTTVLLHWLSSQSQVGRIFPVCPFEKNALCDWWCCCPPIAWVRQTSRVLLEHQDGKSHWLGNGDSLGTGSDLCWSASLLPKLMAGKPSPWPAERTACSLSCWLQGGNHC